jgi:pyruvate dehydrogenase E1 component alpha subunit
LGWKHSYTNGQESPKNVSVSLYGDGAANQGQIFEVMNMAALYKIPAIFVCENNQFRKRYTKPHANVQPEFYRRCDYIPGVYADGMCTLSVQEATRYAKEYCLSGNGPIVIEFDSYRYMGHSMSDPDSAYRKPEDIEAVRSKRDCIENLRYVISSNGFMTEAQLKDIEKEIRKQVDSEHTKAHAAPIQDDLKELATDIYAKDGPTKVPIRSCQGTVWLA